MGTRANWNLTALDMDDSDPMENVDIADVATPIDVTRTEAECSAELTELLAREEYLWRVPKVRCPIKQEDNSVLDPIPCPTCPQFTADPYDQMSRLCAVGRRQAAVCAELDLLRQAEAHHSDVEAALALADAEEAREMAEALL